MVLESDGMAKFVAEWCQDDLGSPCYFLRGRSHRAEVEVASA